MASKKQILANQQNGTLGGVKTDAGKAVSKFNALSHGLLKQTLTSYEQGFYLEVYADFVKQYDPVTVVEKILVERATIYYLKLFRVQKAEQEYMKETLDPRITKMRTGLPSLEDLGVKEEVLHEGYTAQLTPENVDKLADTYTRYEIMLENRFLKIIHELERTIAMRKGQVIPTPTFNVFQMGSFGKNI